MNPFYGRKKELHLLKDLLKKKTSSLIVVKGRRRIGKSRLIKEFGKGLEKGKTYFFSGIAPTEKVTAQMQRDDFSHQLKRELGIPGLEGLKDWGDLFWHLANQTKEGRVLIVLDEINWMGSKDPTFLSKLKTAWDTYFSNNSRLLLVLSGSMSTWIEKNIVSSTGFLGRISLDLTLKELPLSECNHFWTSHKDQVSSYEKFKVLAVTGGVPRYLEEIHPEWSAEKNIKRLCFQKEALLFKEFERIFNDLFVKKGELYRNILNALAQSSGTLSEISHAIGVKKGGTISHALENLVINEYVSEDTSWNLNKGASLRRTRYRLKDNYLRYYLRYIEPVKGLIERGSFGKLPAWDGVLGLQFENLVLSNRHHLLKELDIDLSHLINENPYYQPASKLQEGCQINYMVQTQFNTLHICEIKFSKERISSKVIDEVKRKIQRLNRGKDFSIRPVLIHVNGVTEEVINSGFFASIIDFGRFLSPS